MPDNICSIVRKAEEYFKTGDFKKSQHVSVNPKEDLDTIDAYLNSKFISGPDDDRPFYNIVLAARDIWFRATDIDRKNIKITSDKSSQQLMAILGDAHVKRWMKEANFGQFLNDWGLTLAGYNSAISKWVEKDGKLIPTVIPWQQIICDHVNFKDNPKIEKLYFTPAQLRMNENYNQEMVKALIESAQTTRKSVGMEMQKDQKADYIEVYEVHGNLPLSYLTDKEEDENTYQQQMHIISYKGRGNGFDNFTLYKGKEKQDPYRLTSLLPSDDGSISLWGAVKRLFQAQWMKNHTTKLIKDQLELASKILFQTSDPNFVGKNVLTQIENGEILTYQANNPLTQLNNKPDIAAMQSFGQEWERQGNQSTGISESMMGETAPSGTAWRQVERLLQESHSLFKEMRQNKALAIEEFGNDFIAPYIQKKMDTTEEIMATLEGYQIKQIDSAFVPKEAIKQSNQKIKDDILSGKIAEQPDLGAIESQIQGKLNENGNKRFFKPSEIVSKKWKEVLKDLKFMFECDPTDESVDNQAVIATYDTILKFIIGLQGRPMTPAEEFVFNKLLSRTGYISPVELSSLNSQIQPAMPVGIGGSVAGMGQLQTKPAM